MMGSASVCQLVMHVDPRGAYRCYLCGGPCDGALALVLGDNFSAESQCAAPSSTVMCVACSTALAGRPPNTLRAWSVVYREDRSFRAEPVPEQLAFPVAHPRVRLLRRPDFAEAVRIVLDPPAAKWALGITTTGKIHLVPFLRAREILFDRTRVAPSTALRRAVVACSDLLDAGARRSDLAIGAISPRVAIALGRDACEALRACLTPLAGSPALAFAATIAPKKEVAPA